MVLGKGEATSTRSNPRRFSKRQFNVHSFLRDREVKTNIIQNNDDGHFSSWGNEKNSFRGIENSYKNGFNLNMFHPSTNADTPIRNPSMIEVEETTIMKRALVVIARISPKSLLRDIVVHTNTFQINILDCIGKVCLSMD